MATMATRCDPYTEPLLVRPYMYEPRPYGLGLRNSPLLVYVRIAKGCTGDDWYVGGLDELAHWAGCTRQQVANIVARLQATPLYPDKPNGPKLLRPTKMLGRKAAYKLNYPAGGWPGSTYVAIYNWMLADDLSANELLVYAKVYGYYHAAEYRNKGRGVYDGHLDALAEDLCMPPRTLARALAYLREPHDGKPARLVRRMVNTRLVGVEGRQHREYDTEYAANDDYITAATGLGRMERALLMVGRRLRYDMVRANVIPTESRQQGARANAANRYWQAQADVLGVAVEVIRPAPPWEQEKY